MTAADIDAVSALDAHAFTAGAWPPSAFHGELHENRLARYFLLESPALPGAPTAPPALLGYFGAWVLPGELHLVTIAVDPAAQGQGLGEVLVQQVLCLARRHDAELVTLEVRPSNAAALALYAKYGLVEVGRRRAYYEDNGEDALILTVDGVNTPAFGRDLDRRMRALVEARRLDLTIMEAPPAETTPEAAPKTAPDAARGAE